MKSLKDCIKNYIKYSLNESVWDINESIWDVDDNVESDNKEFVLNEVKRFIKDNYKKVDPNHLTFVFDKEKEKYIVSTKDDLTLVNGAKSLVNDLFEWDTVKGWFDCSQCPITTLEGAPKTVGGNFKCYNCPKLKTLKGAPKRVEGDFSCYSCIELETLEGAPEYVSGRFSCFECPKLETLEGAPKKVGGYFDCQNCPKLSSLDGIGKVKGSIFSDIK